MLVARFACAGGVSSLLNGLAWALVFFLFVLICSSFLLLHVLGLLSLLPFSNSATWSRCAVQPGGRSRATPFADVGTRLLLACSPNIRSSLLARPSAPNGLDPSTLRLKERFSLRITATCSPCRLALSPMSQALASSVVYPSLILPR